MIHKLLIAFPLGPVPKWPGALRSFFVLLRGTAWGIFVGWLIFLSACSAPAPAPLRDYPHGPRCERDGYHRHKPTTEAIK